MNIKFLKGWIEALAAAKGDLTQGSLMHCHAQGLHSIVLNDKPMIRLFITDENHDMWKVDYNKLPSTIAFHPHHCDLTLICIKGLFINYTFNEIYSNSGTAWLDLYRWESKINGGAGAFTLWSKDAAQCGIKASQYNPTSEVSMLAQEYHTVFVPRGNRAAWLVIEGKEDLNFEPMAYSTQDLTQFNSENYYKPISKKKVDELMHWVLG